VLAAPASEVSTESAFSHCGDLTKGKRKRKKVTLEIGVPENEQKAISDDRGRVD